MKDIHNHKITKEGDHLEIITLESGELVHENYYNLYGIDNPRVDYWFDHIFSSLNTAEIRLLDIFYNKGDVFIKDYLNPMNIPYYEMKKTLNELLDERELPSISSFVDKYSAQKFFIETFNLEITEDSVDTIINKYKNKYKLTPRFNTKDKLPGLSLDKVTKTIFIVSHNGNPNGFEHSWDFVRNKECPDSIWGRATNKELRIIELYLTYNKSLFEHSDGSSEREGVKEELNLRNIPLADKFSFSRLDEICNAIMIESPIPWYEAYQAYKRFSKHSFSTEDDYNRPGDWEIMNDDYYYGMSQDELDAFRDNTE